MANSLTVQILEDGARNVVLNVVGVLDTSDVAVVDIAALATFANPVPRGFRIDSVEFTVSSQIVVQLLWRATADVVAATFYQAGGMYYVKHAPLTNNAGAGSTGALRVKTTGWASGTQAFTLLIHLVKMGV